MANPTASADQSAVDSGPQTPSTRGTRSRAGNAMGRTRESALRGAMAAVAKYGSRKATMGDIAMLAGIAKATLYNHFRTREDVYLAVVLDQVDAVASAARTKVPEGFDVAVAEAARLIGDQVALRKIAADDPAALAVLATPGDGPAWTAARAQIAGALSDCGYVASPAAVDVVLRYLASQLLAASTAADRVGAGALLTSAVAAQAPAVPTQPAPPAASPDEGEPTSGQPSQPEPPPAGNAGTSS